MRVFFFGAVRAAAAGSRPGAYRGLALPVLPERSIYTAMAPDGLQLETPPICTRHPTTTSPAPPHHRRALAQVQVQVQVLVQVQVAVKQVYQIQIENPEYQPILIFLDLPQAKQGAWDI